MTSGSSERKDGRQGRELRHPEGRAGIEDRRALADVRGVYRYRRASGNSDRVCFVARQIQAPVNKGLSWYRPDR
ncbi:hypothetical protein RRF57_002765 [Xylaria bambusicola]|uniref:Uncharacterized protein n=1 Tax=Xylaria bambusicola TaxID=326684 RepID=A0AAN7YVW4_9PEZI